VGLLVRRNVHGPHVVNDSERLSNSCHWAFCYAAGHETAEINAEHGELTFTSVSNSMITIVKYENPRPAL
jgi:hypothetical protein